MTEDDLAELEILIEKVRKLIMPHSDKIKVTVAITMLASIAECIIVQSPNASITRMADMARALVSADRWIANREKQARYGWDIPLEH